MAQVNRILVYLNERIVSPYGSMPVALQITFKPHLQLFCDMFKWVNREIKIKIIVYKPVIISVIILPLNVVQNAF